MTTTQPAPSTTGHFTSPHTIDQHFLDTTTAGLCWLLAWAIHQHTHWPIHAIGQPNTTGPLHAWCHVVTELPDGRMLDANGPATRQELLDQWSDLALTTDNYNPTFCPIPADQMGALLGEDPNRRSETVRAEFLIAAQTVLTEYGLRAPAV